MNYPVFEERKNEDEEVWKTEKKYGRPMSAVGDGRRKQVRSRGLERRDRNRWHNIKVNKILEKCDQSRSKTLKFNWNKVFEVLKWSFIKKFGRSIDSKKAFRLIESIKSGYFAVNKSKYEKFQPHRRRQTH